MPRLLLTDDEAEQIRRIREVKSLQAVAYNQALDDLSEVFRQYYSTDKELYEAWIQRVAVMKRPVPAK